MTLQHQREEHIQNSSRHLDTLYHQEEQWEREIEHCFQEEEEGGGEEEESYYSDCFNFRPPLLLDQDLLWEEEELSCLFSKEEQNNLCCQYLEKTPCLANARKEAVKWVVKVTAHHSFCALTAILAVNYLDRFLFSLESHREKPWITQLTAVACLSLAAKVGETQVPLLLDFQICVEESNYVFEAKTIQRMEILVLCTLQWKMNPVTPLSFLDYITRRLGLKNQQLCWEFLKQCQCFLLSVLYDCRVMRYLPSVLAISTLQHVVNSSEIFVGIKYQSQLLGLLGINKEKVEDCCELIKEMESTGHFQPSNKHKLESLSGSPEGINGIGVSFISDSYNDSWEVTTLVSVSTSTPQSLPKKSRTQDQQHTHGTADLQ